MRYINAPLKIEFDIKSSSKEKFKREYDSLSGSDDDSIGEWLRLAKARGNTEESDQVLLALIVELHRKIDNINDFIQGKKQKFLDLAYSADIEDIGYEHFRLKEKKFENKTEYYGRIDMPFFPKRQMPIYFKAISENEAKLVLLHERDEKDWNAYVVARERVMIREMRAKKNAN